MTTRRELLARAAAGAAVLALGDVAAAGALPRSQLRALRSAVRGRVFAPGDRGYGAARVLFNTRFDGIHPPAVVRVRDTADVQAVVRWAGRFDVPLVARSGGNAYHGGSTSRSAVVVDVGGLDRVGVEGGRVVLGPGGRLLPVQAALDRRGLTFPAGSCPNVAVGGHALGGGMGLAGREHGLAVDRVRAIIVVTADGRRRRVTAREDADLFWALRGGGGSFGIVTALELDPVRAADGAWFRVTYPAAQREEALAAFDAFAPETAGALTAILTLTRSGAAAIGQLLGSEARLRRLIAPLTRVDGASVSTAAASHLTLQRRWAGCATGASVRGCAAIPRTSFDASSIYVAQRLPSAGRRAFARAADTGATLLCDAYGGAIARRAPDATAFAHREVRFSVQIVEFAPLAAATPDVRRARRLIAPFGTGAAYQNYPSLDLRAPLQAYYGANLPRLRAVKAAFDPDDRFRPAQRVRA